jgi:hypothetical protein
VSKLSLFDKLARFGSKRASQDAQNDLENRINSSLSNPSKDPEEWESLGEESAFTEVNTSPRAPSPYTPLISSPQAKKNTFSLPRFTRKNILAKRHIGVVFDGKSLLCSNILCSETKIKIQDLVEFTTSPDSTLVALQQKVGTREWENAVFASALSATKTIARPITLEFYKAEELDEIIKYQMEPNLPYPIEEAQIGTVQFSNLNAPPYFFECFATQKQTLKEHLHTLLEYKLDPEIVAPKSLALLSFASTFFDDENTRFFIDISASETIILLMHKTLPLSLRTISLSLYDDQGEENHLEKYAKEISRILVALKTQFPVSEKAPAVFTGVKEEDAFLTTLLAKLIELPEEKQGKLPAHITLDDAISPTQITQYAIPIGLALLSSPLKKALSFTFRKQEFAYAKKWRRWKKDLVLYFGILAALTLFLSTLLFSSLQKDEQKIRHEYRNLLTLLNQKQEDVEKAYLHTQGISVQDTLSLEDIENRVLFIENTLLKRPYNEIALHPNLPRAADLFAFLAMHPQVKEGGFVFEKLRYTMIKRPDKEHLKDHYKVQVHLEFTSQNPTKAREFYDALNSPNAFVDPKEEIQWNTAKDRYTVSFVLKDKTQYP